MFVNVRDLNFLHSCSSEDLPSLEHTLLDASRLTLEEAVPKNTLLSQEGNKTRPPTFPGCGRRHPGVSGGGRGPGPPDQPGPRTHSPWDAVCVLWVLKGLGWLS